MILEWDLPIEMDDGIVLSADMFRRQDYGPCLALLSCSPSGNGLTFTGRSYGS